MRSAFINALIQHAASDASVFLVVGDLGYSVVEPYAHRFPDRFLNAGVAEQNMTGIAAGLASEGYHVFTYSIANFPSLRCLEQIRNDVCYAQLPVTIVSVGAGLAYGSLGFSHHGIHDIAALRCLPHITLASPADPHETRATLDYLIKHPGPSYMRLGKAGEQALHELPLSGTEPVEVVTGRFSLALVATGSILRVAIEAASRLRAIGCDPCVFSVPFLAPVAKDQFAAIWKCANVITVEEHVLAGGLGSMLREIAPDHVRFRSCAVRGNQPGVVGSQDYLRRLHGLDVQSIFGVAQEFVRNEL